MTEPDLTSILALVVSGAFCLKFAYKFLRNVNAYAVQKRSKVSRHS